MSYYEPKDLADFPNITEWAQKEGNKFFEYYGAATGAGKLTELEKSLIALTVAITQNCPYCIDAYTTKCLSLGISSEGIMNFNMDKLKNREIVINNHCYGCVAGCGS